LLERFVQVGHDCDGRNFGRAPRIWMIAMPSSRRSRRAPNHMSKHCCFLEFKDKSSLSTASSCLSMHLISAHFNHAYSQSSITTYIHGRRVTLTLDLYRRTAIAMWGPV
ncbi:hypothetical protein KCU61_g296, partial [Aureobasidium melanogenum]